jgi:hypothetical protein
MKGYNNTKQLIAIIIAVYNNRMITVGQKYQMFDTVGA